MKNIVGYEYHIDAEGTGKFHIVSETPLADKTLSSLYEAAEILFHQYGSPAPICCIVVPSLKKIREASVSLEKTYENIYLANVDEMLMLMSANGLDDNCAYLFSHELYLDFHKKFKEDLVVAENLLSEAYKTTGLLYGVITESPE